MRVHVGPSTPERAVDTNNLRYLTIAMTTTVLDPQTVVMRFAGAVIHASGIAPDPRESCHLAVSIVLTCRYMPTPPDHLSRTPPVALRRELRREVGFGCPVQDCGNPYLEYHHFDPPWAVKEHHDPSGMIALCVEHHAKAAAWTTEQFRAMKSQPSDRAALRGRFEWMRDDVLAVVGGNLYYEVPNIFVVKGNRVIWFERDSECRLLLNLQLLTLSGQPRARLENNDWIIEGEPLEVESPPNGSSLKVRYDNGDSVSVKFREWTEVSKLAEHFPTTLGLKDYLKFPLVTVEITYAVAGTNINFDSKSTTLPGIRMTDCVIAYGTSALVFD